MCSDHRQSDTRRGCCYIGRNVGHAGPKGTGRASTRCLSRQQSRLRLVAEILTNGAAGESSRASKQDDAIMSCAGNDWAPNRAPNRRCLMRSEALPLAVLPIAAPSVRRDFLGRGSFVAAGVDNAHLQRGVAHHEPWCVRKAVVVDIVDDRFVNPVDDLIPVVM